MSSLRFLSPWIARDLAEMKLASLYNILQSISTWNWECMHDNYDYSVASLQIRKKILAATPDHFRKALLDNPMEIAADVAAMGLSSKMGNWRRAGEEFGRIITILADRHALNTNIV